MCIGHLYVLFGEMSVQVLCPFFNWIVCFFGIEFYEFLISFKDINSLSGVAFGEYIFPFSGLSLFCWWFPLLCKKFLVWCSPICLFFFCFPCLGQYIEKTLLQYISKICLKSVQDTVWRVWVLVSQCYTGYLYKY